MVRLMLTSLDSPLAKTGARAQKEPLARPTARQPQTPTGEVRNRPRKSILTNSIGVGYDDFESATGTAASETRIEATENRMKFDGASSISTICPSVTTVRLIMV
jgi:hypothetical protein